MNPLRVKYTKAALVLMIMGAIMTMKKRKVWVQKRLVRKKGKGCYENLMRELALKDSEGYRRWLRMDTASFEYLLELVTPIISRKDTRMRKAIPASEKLALTLRYLATGQTQNRLSFQFQIAQNTISGILKYVCDALVMVLSGHLQTPSTEAEWHTISQQFENKWQFPMCMGALAGKLVKMTPPRCRHKEGVNLIVMALVDADLKFLFVDVGKTCIVSDSMEWENCKLKLALEKNTLKFPEGQYLPKTQTKAPFVIATDDTFPLTMNLIKSFPNEGLKKEQSIFNYRLSRALRVAENAFGILGDRFQILKGRIYTDPVNATKTVLACFALHNFLLERNSTIYVPASSIDVEDIDNRTIRLGEWRKYSSDAFAPLAKQKTKPELLAEELRNTFCTYLNGTGAVPWQRDLCLPNEL